MDLRTLDSNPDGLVWLMVALFVVLHAGMGWVLLAWVRGFNAGGGR